MIAVRGRRTWTIYLRCGHSEVTTLPPGEVPDVELEDHTRCGRCQKLTQVYRIGSTPK